MPYTIIKQGSRFCVARNGEKVPINDGNGSCHATKADAQKQLVAIMLSEEKRKHAKMSAEFSDEADFSKLSKADRDKLSESDFGDPKNRKYPIVDASDVMDAASLIGKADNPEAVKARIIRIAKRKGFKIPEAWQSERAQMAAFDLDGETWEEDGLVYRVGKLFEVGEYPDKEFSLSEEEAATAAADFEACELGIEHRPSVLSGKLGHLVAVDLADDGKTLVGVTAIPKWLHSVTGEAPLPVSTEWHKTTKRLIGLGLCLRPRVTDAALMTAFSEAHPTDPAPAAASDSSVQHQTARQPGTPGRKLMSLMDALREAKDSFLAGFSKIEAAASSDAGGGADSIADAAVTVGNTPPPVKPPPARFDAIAEGRIKALEEANASLLKNAETEKTRRIEADAKAFADEQVTNSRATPGEKPLIIAQFTQAARDDEATPEEVVFSADREGRPISGSRVEMLRASYGARQPHDLLRELLPADMSDEMKKSAFALFNRQETDPNSPEAVAAEVDEILASTSEGREILKARQARGRG